MLKERSESMFLELLSIPVRKALAEFGFWSLLPQTWLFPDSCWKNVLLIAPKELKTEAVLLPIFSNLQQQEETKAYKSSTSPLEH
jgi:Lhr-like helicase